MRTNKQITVQLSKLEILYSKLNVEFNKLDLKEIQNSSGNVLLKKINTTNGKIKALKWVLDNEKFNINDD